ncbi:MAG: hypothetical protein IKH51_11680 [Clostridia bacterium]|jgi:hypothetical protein|nr:hypothetical protein [Clostridia bacterium]
MKCIDVYERYFEGYGVYNGVERHGVAVKLTGESDNGMINYRISVNFFPHNDEEDFAVSYDAYFDTEIYNGKGRRSKKKESAYLDVLKSKADELAEANGGEIFWDKPLTDERRG